ncbi:hypothetical protein DYH09_21280 [bacterium CPR1]|nr:hypothetical protein [bacterium CPR1]
MLVHSTMPQSASQLERRPPPGARPAEPAGLDSVRLSNGASPAEEPPEPRKVWKAALAGGLLAAAAVAGVIGVVIHAPESILEKEQAIEVGNGYGAFQLDQKVLAMQDRALELVLELPEPMRGRGDVSVQVHARDSAGAVQWTSWTAGIPVAENPGYDAATGLLKLTYDPTLRGESIQGHTDPAFDPARLLHDLKVGINSPVDGTVRLLQARLVKVDPGDPARAQERPLLKTTPDAPRPLRLDQVKHGVSQYIHYGDLHDFESVRPDLEKTFAAQQDNGLDSFRWMGGLDVRQTAGGIRLGEREHEAMRQALELAERYGQKNFMVTLLDGAIPNQTVQKAMNDPQARQQLVEALRPFVREFGERPIVWDLVNEIHGVSGVTEAGRQALVDDLVELFAQEAPGATLTVGMQNYRELSHWTYLAERHRDQKFLYTFHLYEPIANVPAAWELNLPPNAEVGITEADPARGVRTQVRQAAEKGYSWMLFWEDGRFDYDPGAHARALR